MYYVIAFVLLLLFLSAIRNLRGNSIWDYLMGMNLISTKVIIVIVMFASAMGIDYLLDFAIIYALTGFIGTIFVASFMHERMSGSLKATKNAEGENK